MMNLNVPAIGLCVLAGGLVATLAQPGPSQDAASTSGPRVSSPAPIVPSPHSPSVVGEAPTIKQGILRTTLNEADVLVVLRSHREGVRRCLRQHIRSGDTQGGIYRVSLNVRPSGEPSRISIGPVPKTCALAACLKAEISTWRFPAFSGPTMPLDFPVHVRLPAKR